MLIRSRLLVTAAAALSLTLSANGAPLFTEDFEDLTPGAQFTDGLGVGGGTKSTSSGTLQTASNTGSPFGSGNIYADMHDNDPAKYISAQSAAYAVGNAVSTFKFDFYEPTATDQSSSIGFGYAMSPGELTSAGNRVRPTLSNGTIGGLSGGTSTYDLDTAYTLYMIFNDTASSITYDGGTLAAHTADIWFEDFGGGNLTYAGSKTATNSQTANYFVAFRTFSGTLEQLYVDNVSLELGAAAVPEPSAALLGAVATLLLLGRRRRA